MDDIKSIINIKSNLDKSLQTFIDKQNNYFYLPIHSNLLSKNDCHLYIKFFKLNDIDLNNYSIEDFYFFIINYILIKTDYKIYILFDNFFLISNIKLNRSEIFIYNKNLNINEYEIIFKKYNILINNYIHDNMINEILKKYEFYEYYRHLIYYVEKK